MAGKGKGRGKGRGGNMAVHDLMRSNAEDLDIDERGMNNQDAPPSIWPEIEGGMPALLPMTQDDRVQIDIQRRIIKRIRHSPYFIKDVKKVPDVIRWGERHNIRDVNYEKLHTALSSSECCMPPELLDIEGSNIPKPQKRLRTNSISEKELKALAEIEGNTIERSESTNKQNQEIDPDVDDNAAEDEFDQDYLENHYESADEDDGGGDSGGESYI